MAVSQIEEVIEDIKAGKMIILVDDEDRENEGDLCMAAELVTTEAINFMAKYGRGLICLTLTPDHVDRLELPMMVANNQSPYGTGFTISIEARTGVTTGISAADRARTIQAAVANGYPAPRSCQPRACFSFEGQKRRSSRSYRSDGRLGRPSQACRDENVQGLFVRS